MISAVSKLHVSIQILIILSCEYTLLKTLGHFCDFVKFKDTVIQVSKCIEQFDARWFAVIY